MSVSRRSVIAVLSALLLAACGGSTSHATPPPPPTPVPPTTSYVEPAAGPWSLYYEITLSGSPEIEQVKYAGGVTLDVTTEGTVSGSGYFSPQATETGCDAQVLDTEAIGFTVNGTTFPDEGGVGIAIDLVPDAPDRPENYRLVCGPTFVTHDVSVPLLWPALSAVQERTLDNASGTGLTWRFLLQSGVSYHIDADLNAESGSTLAGSLSVDFTLTRN